TSYLLVNKRLPVKLQKPYAASSGIVSIIATNQSGACLCAVDLSHFPFEPNSIWGLRPEF
ncbi:MAG: hypothetical protein E7E41_03140, partial [Klebsiella oxytoca]|nr:hypothetical protein [Klebsiella oxytoca]MDU5380529.1 hypothetical protein [Actinomyces sp.]MDU2796636.1 hypothetical protein [Klebsiella oxytoca]MDU2887487.1 hypothetical protein [Klebsiella oxytoca]MDU3021679.1 hypothetical protein [Klebsiella oxytoca]